MILLDTTTKSLEIVLGGAVTANQLPFAASWVDMDAAAFYLLAGDSADGATNSTTAVTLVSAPASNRFRQLKWLTVQNADTASATVTVRLNNGGTTRTLWKVTLSPGDQLLYTLDAGLQVFDQNGNVKGAGGGTGGSGTVTSVGLSLPGVFTVTGSPVTTSGTLTATLATESANTVWAGPTSGGAASPTFRSLVAADIPSLGTSQITSGFPWTVAQGGTGAATLTAHGVLLGEGTGAVTATSAGAAGQLLVGQGATSDPSFQTVSGSGATVTLSAAGVFTISNVANSALANSSVTVSGAGGVLVSGSPVSLGGTVTVDGRGNVAETTVNTSGTTLSVATRYLLKDLGTPANYTTNLPSSPSTGDRVWVRIDPGMTKLATLDAGAGKAINGKSTTLNGAITAGATSLVVTSASGFPASGPFAIQIDSEILWVTAGQGTTTWTVTRGVAGTAAASHNNGVAVDWNRTRTLWASEEAELRWDGTQWEKVSGVTIPMTAVGASTSGVATVSSGVDSAVNLDKTVSDPTGLMVSGNVLNVQRTGAYFMASVARWSNIASGGARFYGGMWLTRAGTTTHWAALGEGSAQAGSYFTTPCNVPYPFVAGDQAALYCGQGSGTNQTLYGDGTTQGSWMSLQEIPSW